MQLRPNACVVSSKNDNFSTPRLFATEFTIKLDEVPINVQAPPRIPANEIGNNNLDFRENYYQYSVDLSPSTVNPSNVGNNYINNVLETTVMYLIHLHEMKVKPTG